jgi:hypothetical protein
MSANFFTSLGGDIKKLFSWLSSPKGIQVAQAVEGAAEAVFPAADGVITLVNSWLTEIFKSQALATAAEATPGVTTNTAKAALVLSAVTPQAVQFAQQNGLPALAASDLNTVNTQLVNILNILSGAAKDKATPSVTSTLVTEQAPAKATTITLPGNVV